MRVCWVLESAGRPGGVERVVQQLDAGLRDRGVASRVESWLVGDPEPNEARPFWLLAKARRARDRRSAARSAARGLAAQLAADSDLVAVLDPGSLAVARRLPPGARWGVHVHWAPDLLLHPWRYIRGEPVTGLVRLLLLARLRQVGWGNRRLLRRAPFLVTITPSHSVALRTLHSAVVEVPNPVDVRIAIDRVDDLTSGPVVGFVGRLTWEKGPDLFLDVVASLQERLPELRAVVAGAGELEPELRARAGRLALRELTWLGWVDDPATVFAQLDVLLLPSRSEAFGLVLLEALAAGCSVVAADAGPGVRDLLDEGLLGAVVPVDDVRAMTDAVLAALDERRTPPPGRAEAVRAVVLRHRPEQIVDRWVQLLPDLGRRP